jgi:hypothetical protein
MEQLSSPRELAGDRETAANGIPPEPGLRGWLYKRVPALDSLRSYSWKALGGDLTAGLATRLLLRHLHVRPARIPVGDFAE